MSSLSHTPPSVLLVRHGESASNAGMVTHEPARIPLTRRGHAQARRFAELLGAPPARVISSTYTRAIETAQPVREEHGLAREFAAVHEFTYLAPARCHGTDRDDRRPWVEAYWRRCDPLRVDGPGAESFAEFVARVIRFRDAVARGAYSGDVVFTHGLFMKALMWLGERRPDLQSRYEMRAFNKFSGENWVPNLGMLRVTAGTPSRPQLRVKLDLTRVHEIG